MNVDLSKKIIVPNHTSILKQDKKSTTIQASQVINIHPPLHLNSPLFSLNKEYSKFEKTIRLQSNVKLLPA